jgi:hypothetical protein
MIIQNNPTPWVILILLAVVGCVVIAMMFGADPFGPGPEVRAEIARTELAIAAQATQGALGAVQTPLAISIEQTAVAGAMTAMPPIQTATAIALAENHAAVQQAATQTAIANAQYIDQVAVAATATTISSNTRAQNSTRMAGISLAIVVIVVLGLWIAGRTTVNVIRARAQFLKEQREMAEFRAAHQKSSRQPSIPTSLMKQNGNRRDLPRAE